MSREDTKARATLISTAGVLASLALHLMVMAPILIGFGTSARQPPLVSDASESPTDHSGSSMTLMLIDDSDANAKDAEDRSRAQLAASPPLNSVLLTVPPPKFESPADDDGDPDQHNVTVSSRSDPELRLLFGRYMTQISARIDRAWIRPRTPIDADYFACRVRITQDHTGTVQEIELVKCNGDPRWQTSLVRAIQSASPLPAPPDASVFSNHLTLDIQSSTFLSGDTADQFETAINHLE